MANTPKPSPIEAFDATLADAHHLVLLADALTNARSRKMRSELRDRVGSAFRVPAKNRGSLDCVESSDAWLVMKPGSRLTRARFTDHKPLLRQAVVAACAAGETYIADKVMTRVSALTVSESAATPRLHKLPMTVGDWLRIEDHYSRRRWGLHAVIATQIGELASLAPSQFGALLSLAGVDKWSAAVDRQRGVAKGETEQFLDRFSKRRNKIAHTGDRQGHGRAPLTVPEVEDDLATLQSVVAALEVILA